jgi:pimeloyl-ACP methyl ester carboxylesterase
MWNITSLDENGERRTIHFLEVEPSRTDVAAALNDVMRGETFESFRSEVQQPDPLPGIEGTESWGEQAVGLIGGHVRLDRIQILTEVSVPAIQTEYSMAYHDPTVLVANVSEEKEIEISKEGIALYDPVGPYYRFPAESFLEARLYTNQCVEEAEIPQGVSQRPEGISFRLKLPGGRAGLIARVARVFSAPVKHTTDNFMRGRLQHFEQRYHVIASMYPDISLSSAATGQFQAISKAPEGASVIIFVHGTFSCSIPNLSLLHPLPLLTFRFEHDTFLPLITNAEALKDAITTYVPKGARIHLIAHSRGGLVARLAAREINSDYDIKVVTCGTPHKGTPLANAGHRLLSAVLSSGRAVVDGAFSWDPPSLAGKFLLKGMLSGRIPFEFPDGLDAMRSENASLLGNQEPFPICTWGAEYSPNQASAGRFRLALDAAITGAFNGKPNDCVVESASSLAIREREPVLSQCSHFEYFSSQRVRDYIQRLT